MPGQSILIMLDERGLEMADSSMKVPAVIASGIIGLLVGAGAMFVSLKGLGYMDPPRPDIDTSGFNAKMGGGGKGGGKGGLKGGKGGMKEGNGEAAPGGDKGDKGEKDGKAKGDAAPGGDKGG